MWKHFTTKKRNNRISEHLIHTHFLTENQFDTKKKIILKEETNKQTIFNKKQTNIYLIQKTQIITIRSEH